MFSFFRKKPYFTSFDNDRIVAAIKQCETTTSGEIRVFIEHKNPLVNTLQRAQDIFFQLKMQHTAERNAVLVYVAMGHREIALFGDEGIHNKVGVDFWEKEVKLMLRHFSEGNIAEGLVKCITDVGNVLKEKFPYNSAIDKNELPDEIVFGK